MPKHVGAILGGVFYLVAAVGIRSEIRAAAWGIALLPIVPVTVLTLWGAGVALPVAPDGPMVGILVLQLVAAGLAAAILRAPAA